MVHVFFSVFKKTLLWRKCSTLLESTTSFNHKRYLIHTGIWGSLILWRLQTNRYFFCFKKKLLEIDNSRKSIIKMTKYFTLTFKIKKKLILCFIMSKPKINSFKDALQILFPLKKNRKLIQIWDHNQHLIY